MKAARKLDRRWQAEEKRSRSSRRSTRRCPKSPGCWALRTITPTTTSEAIKQLVPLVSTPGTLPDGIDRAPRSDSGPRALLLPDRAISRGDSASRRDARLGTGQPRARIHPRAGLHPDAPAGCRREPPSLARSGWRRIPPARTSSPRRLMLRLEMEPQAEAELKRGDREGSARRPAPTTSSARWRSSEADSTRRSR